MSKIPFYIGNFLAIFVPDGARRARVRGNVNATLYAPRIKHFIRRVYGENVKKIRFVRQINLNRVCCVANDKYYIKLFRNITPTRVKNYQELMDFIRPRISVCVPKVYADDKMAMYVSEKIPGREIKTFDDATILRNENKIKEQVFEIIKEIQNIKLDDVPNVKRFVHSLQPERNAEPPIKKPHPVLAHFDLNETNLLFDDDMNIVGIIDWDMCSIAKNPDTDLHVFNFFWNRFMGHIKKPQ